MRRRLESISSPWMHWAVQVHPRLTPTPLNPSAPPHSPPIALMAANPSI